ncbi:class I SAM-dependent methyltransferase [Candidatus Parcubacteria bacterium]|nr:class I SAM-dependent methyltransferase [Candidatus Parcubacteria bacterium]
MNKNLIPENYNSQNLVNMWRDYIDWDKRRIGEENFLVNQLRKYNVKKVFDAALGDGCDSIYLIKQGFDVISNEIDKIFLNKALEHAKSENIELKTTSLDWRELDKELLEKSFDAVLCLGNSLTYLFTEKNQIDVLNQFRRILRNKSIFIIDERNYQYILDNRKEILKGNFRYSGRYIYCGKKVHNYPVEISDQKVKFEIVDKRTGKKDHFIVYPFKRGEMKNLLSKASFKSVEQFSDFKSGEDINADFYQYVCVK